MLLRTFSLLAIALAIILLVVFLLLRWVNASMFSFSDDRMAQLFSQINHTPNFKYVETSDRKIHYMVVGDKTKPAVLFVHGSPGTWKDLREVFTNSELIDHFHFIAIDRPGFGKSGVGIPERSLIKQAEAVGKVLEQENTSAILVGHSYGGAVIPRVAIDYPDLVDGLVIVAGSVDPDLEKTKWYQILVHYKILSWILPKNIFSTNEEILALKNELVEMSNHWHQITHKEI